MVRPSTKWAEFGTSIFSQMTQAAARAGAINLAQGFPDFDGPDVVKAAAIAALRGGFNQYAPSAGLPELRQLLAARQAARTGLSYLWEAEVTVFSGATEALFCALQALFGPGDEVLTFEPFFDCYPAGVFAAGARLVTVPLLPPDWRFDAAALRRAVTPRTRGIIVNTPHNPTGRVFSRAELEVIRDLAVTHDLFVITDEVYEEIVYAPAEHVALATLPGMAERTVTISSTAKTFSFTGWKVGYAFAPEPLSKALRAVHQFTVFCSATPLQAGMIAALKLGDDYYGELRRDYAERRDALGQMLTAAGFRINIPEGTYFILADYTRHAPGLTDLEFAMWLTETVQVAAIPISVFFSDPGAAAKRLRYVRFAFCKDMATLKAAEKRLAKLGG